jgi:hypothetical protein
MMAGSGIAFFALARQFHSAIASAVGALFFMMAPYHTLDLYVRGALPELAGFVFVPLILLLAFRAGRDGRPWRIAALGLAQGLFILFHFPVSYILLPTVAVHALIWAAMRNDWRIAARIALGTLVGLGVSASWWLVALLERKHTWEPFTKDFPYHGSYVTALPNMPWFERTVAHCLSALLIALVVSILIAGSARLDRRLRANRPDAGTQIVIFRWLAIGTCFMVTPYSAVVATMIPNVDAVSFAWRWLVPASCFAVLAFTAAVEAALPPARRREPKALYALGVAAVFAFNLIISIRIAVPAFAVTNANLYAPTARMENGFRPGRARGVESLPDTERVLLQPPGGGTASVVDWSPARREVVLDLREQRDVRLKTYRFRGWKARLDGRVVPLEADADIAQVVRVPPGRHRLVVTFENVRTVTAAESISLAVILGALGLLTVEGIRRLRRRRS